jgi:hypothetical protein
VLLVLAFTGAAHGAGRHERWKAVEQLAQGKPIEVQVQGLAGTEGCRLVSVDDSALTCVRERDPDADWDAASGARLVFPRASVRNVWLMGEASGWSIGRWIAVGVSVGLVVAGSVGGGVIGGAIVGGVVLAVWKGWYDVAQVSLSRQPPPLHRRLIYRAIMQTATP